MPTRKTAKKSTRKSTKSTKSRKAGGKKSSQEAVMWLRLPRAMSVQELAKLGLQSDPCFGGNTCIAATSMRADVGIVVEGDPQAALVKTGLSRRADPCFGGDTCIV